MQAKTEVVMLVLARKLNERIQIGGRITVTVVDIRGDKVRLGIEAPREVPVHREEIQTLIIEAQTDGN
jgi:carbon storage regulator